MQVADSMHPTPITVRPEELVRTASQRMRGNNIRHLPVVTGAGTLVGMLTDRDLRQASASDAPPLAAYELPALLATLTVQEVMTRQVTTVRRHTSVAAAAQLFVAQKFGCLPVVRDDNTLEGILTVTDLLRAYVAPHEVTNTPSEPVGVPGRVQSPRREWAVRWRGVGGVPGNRSARQEEGHMDSRTMMQTEVVTVTPETSLAAAQRLMRAQRIRHLPVVSGTRLVGIVTDRDIRQAVPSPATTLSRGEIAYQMDTTPVQACMTREVRAIGPDTAMVHAARLLLEHRFGCLPVVEAGTLVGVVTEIDCLRAFLAAEGGSRTEE